MSYSVTWCHIVKENVIWVYCRIDNALSIVSQRHGARSTHSLAPNNLHTVTMSNKLNNLQLFKIYFFHLNVGETFVNTQQNTLSNIRIYWHVAQCLADSLICPDYVNIVDWKSGDNLPLLVFLPDRWNLWTNEWTGWLKKRQKRRRNIENYSAGTKLGPLSQDE